MFSAAMLAASSAAMACTGLIAGKGATVDGSVLVTYAADSHTLYGELYYQPAANHPKGAVRKIVEWDTGKPLGEIPEVSHTYARMGNMNEHALCITESTWGGRHELAGSGLIDYGSLIYITLERAKTAREAMAVMTDLVHQYGYASEGESCTIPQTAEAGLRAMIGQGKSAKGAVWVARRIPDDCIAGHANHSRIHKFPQKDIRNTLYSSDVISFARKQGYFTGKDEDFDFSRAYAVYDGGALRGCDGRVWAYFNKFNSAMAPYLDWVLKGEGQELPLWVKPDKKLSAKDLKWMMRDHFEDTPMDMTKDIGAGPYKVPYRWRPLTYKVDSVEYTHERAIATQQTGFSLVAQLRADAPELMRGVLWFGVDDANTCVYLPVYNCLNEVPHQIAVGNGDLYNLSWNAAFWVTNYVANQAYNRYSQMIPDIRKVQCAMEDSIDMEVATLYNEIDGLDEEIAVRLLNGHTADWADKYTKRYKQLGDYLFVKYLDGNVKKERDGGFARNEYGLPEYPEFPGYDERYFRSIVNDPDGGERLKLLILPGNE